MAIRNLEIVGVEPVQADGDFAGRELYFRARHVYWHLELSNCRGELPSNGASRGFYRHGFAANASYLPTEEVSRLIEGGVEEFEALVSALPWLFEDDVNPESLAAKPGESTLDDAICRLLAISAPRVISEFMKALSASRPRVKASLDRLERAGKVCALTKGRGKYWMLKSTAVWLRFLY